MDNYNELNQILGYVDMPIVLLVLALNVIGFVLKQSQIANRWIPVVLLVIGTVGGYLLMQEQYGVVKSAFIGLIGAGVSVGVHSGVKNFIQK